MTAAPRPTDKCAWRFGHCTASVASSVYLNFHGLGQPADHADVHERRYWLAPQRFEQILRLVTRHRSARRVCITFDDGNLSDATIALPILQALRWRASFFIPIDVIGAPNFMSAADIAGLHAAGMRIGSHGAAHVPFTSLESAELEAQVRRSLQVLSGIVGQPVREVAVPYGAYDRRVLSVLHRLGICQVLTSDGGRASRHAWIKPRNTVRADTTDAAIERLLDGRSSASERFRAARRFLRQRLGPGVVSLTGRSTAMPKG